SHGLYCVNSQNRALSLLLPSSPTIQASRLAKAVLQPTLMLNVEPLSRAGSLPQWSVQVLMKY
ncbi:hypothetical protein C1Y11_28625, partial [Pseudomonas sp. FW305-20]